MVLIEKRNVFMETVGESKRVVVVGAGVMGAAIAQVLAGAGASVVCTDRSPEQLAEAARLVAEGRHGWERAVERGWMTQSEHAAARSRLRFEEGMECLAIADIVLEAIPEDLQAKMRLFAELGRSTRSDAVLATNTSGLPVIAMAEAAGHPERVLGWHWSSPAQRMKLAEVVRTPVTDPAAVAMVCTLARECGKDPVVINENPQAWGFVANRVLRAAIRESAQVVAEGIASSGEVDQIMRNAFGWPVGPLSVLVGATTGWGDDRKGSVGDLLG
jgi:3-hydroxybutyryl-CoA dehydrogenase